ncbi:MAG: VanW family protein [Clostridia bacterium]|nr:VanW family protein [Clostridia bacterium]
MKKIIKTLLLLTVITTTFLGSVKATTYFVTGEGVRVRSSAENREDNIIGRLAYGTQIDVVNTNGSWYLIKYGNGYGYVTRTFINTRENVISTKTIATTKKNATLKKSSSSSSKTICKIPKNSAVKVINKASSWSYVQYNGEKGYVKNSYLKYFVNNNETCLGCYTISYCFSNSSRSNNITKAANKLNNYVLKPGQTFSFLSVVGTSGYANAPEFTKNKKVLGGGISQVSTSLYQCIRDAQRNSCFINVKNQERYGSKTPYAKLGEEAMIDLKARKDLTFTNNNHYSIKIYSYVSGNSVSFVIAAMK